MPKKKKFPETIIVAAFAHNQESSVLYRKYKKKCSVGNIVTKLLAAHAVDVISIRVINRQKQLKLESFLTQGDTLTIKEIVVPPEAALEEEE